MSSPRGSWDPSRLIAGCLQKLMSPASCGGWGGGSGQRSLGEAQRERCGGRGWV